MAASEGDASSKSLKFKTGQKGKELREPRSEQSGSSGETCLRHEPSNQMFQDTGAQPSRQVKETLLKKSAKITEEKHSA